MPDVKRVSWRQALTWPTGPGPTGPGFVVMIGSMPLPAGRYAIGPENGPMQVRTHREGIAQKVGHDLVLDVPQWQATVEVVGDGTVSSIELEVDSGSLQVREGLGGVKPLTDKDRADIRKNIDEKILRGQPISFRSAAVESSAGMLTVRGELSLAGASRSVSFGLETTDDGHLTGTLPLIQSEWGIKPYRGLMGALKVRDAVEIVVDVQLPPD
jgi:polyisoprenoid-binding protein YceI